MRIIPLGTNGFFPTFGRHTTSFLLLHQETALLLDAGSGIARLTEPGIAKLLQPFSELHIILSHYHLDHVVGLSYMIGIFPDIALSIYAPGPPFVQSSPQDALGTLIRPPFFSVTLDDFPMHPRIVSVVRDTFDIDRLTVAIRGQKHRGGSIGIRVDDLVFMTDTAVDTSAVSFVHGAKLLLHEVWLRDEDLPASPEELADHSFESGVCDIAQRANVRQLMPIHLHPRRTLDEVMSLGKRMMRDGLQIILPEEGRVYEVG
jgi:ribonuclease BN (tRNA processing enzyme)